MLIVFKCSILYGMCHNLTLTIFFGMPYLTNLTNKEAEAVYNTVIKHDGHLRIRGKCRKHEPQAYLTRTLKSRRV